MRCVVYIRVSTEEQTDGYSPDAQRRACEQRAQVAGLRVVQVYEDLGISGKNEHRPALQRLLADLRTNRVQAVIVDHTDRLSRNLRVLLNITETLQRHGVQLYTSKGLVDMDSDQGIIGFQIEGIFAEQYLRNLARETKKGLREKARQGLWVGGICPYGYVRVDKDTIAPANNASTDAVQEIFTLYATKQYSIRQLCDAMNLRSAHWGRTFGAESLRDILQNRAYVGDVSSGKEYFPGKHEAIISEALWQECAAIRKARTHGRRTAALVKQGPSTLLIGGLGRCARCGQTLWTSNSGRGQNHTPYYRCAGTSRRTCDARQQNARRIDTQVLDLIRGLALAVEFHDAAIQRLLDQEQPAPPTPGPDPAAIQQRIDRLTLAWVNGNISDAAYQAQLASLKAQLVPDAPQVATRLDLRQARRMLADLSSVIDAATLEERRTLVQMLFDAVDVDDQRVQAVQPKKATACCGWQHAVA